MADWTNPHFLARELISAIRANQLDGHPAANNQEQQADDDAHDAKQNSQNCRAKHDPYEKSQAPDCLNCCANSDKLPLLYLASYGWSLLWTRWL